MPPMWFKMIKVLVLLFALFTTIVCINSEISKRREAEAAAANAAAELAALKAAASGSSSGNSKGSDVDMSGFTSENVLAILRGPNKTKELQAKDLNKILEELFIVNDDKGLHLFNTTTADSAPSSPVMPIPTMLAAQPQPQSQSQRQSPVQTSHYHQYHGLSQPDQYFKGTNAQAQVQQQQQQPQQQSTPAPHIRRPPSDTFVFPGSEKRYLNVSNSSQCGDEPNQESKSFCTQVDNYPDLSALKQKLAGKFARFFNDELQPQDVSARVGTADDEVFLCRTNRRILYPKKGLKADNSWQLIVNDEEFKQGIQIEECEEKDLPCGYAENFPQRYKPVCRQHFVMRNLASIPNSGQLDVVQDVFKIPSCCKCVLVKNL
ncbi:protein spaetzle isoform X3 [Drosophila kikkawai]|uniref:Protein spaetzle isoform X3 n=1 Tax=Drosophila kikkawai TaxID=30033 RepID=A0A6P4JQA4_DROKI|nr:protein spaetzle isoform X3 [Drosophila kikkawai]